MEEEEKSGGEEKGKKGEKLPLPPPIPAGHEKEEYGKLALALGVCFVSMFSNSLILSTTHDLSPWNHALTDQVFETFPEQGWAVKVGDVSAAGLAFSLLFFGIFHSITIVLFRRVLILTTFMYALRAICLAFTTLPVGYKDPSLICMDQAEDFDLGAIFLRAVTSFFTMGASSGTKIPCGDLFYSGHTIVLTLSPTFFQHYSPRPLRPLSFVLWFVCIVGMVMLAISRSHYTIDIVISFILTRAVFALYHSFVCLPHATRDTARLGRLSCLLQYVQWMEARTPFGPPPTVLRWPFFRPHLAHRLFAALSALPPPPQPELDPEPDP